PAVALRSDTSSTVPRRGQAVHSGQPFCPLWLITRTLRLRRVEQSSRQPTLLGTPRSTRTAVPRRRSTGTDRHQHGREPIRRAGDVRLLRTGGNRRRAAPCARAHRTICLVDATSPSDRSVAEVRDGSAVELEA